MARDTMLQAYNIRESIGDTNGMAWSLATSMTQYYRAQGNYRQSRKCIEDGLEFMYQLGNKKGINMCNGIIALYMSVNGELDSASSLANETYRLGLNTNEFFAQVAGLATLSFLACVRDSDYTTGFEHFEKLRLLFDATVHAHLDMGTLWGYCLALVGTGQFDHVRRHYDALVHDRHFPEANFMTDFYISSSVICFICEAIILTRQGDTEQAVELIGLIDRQVPEVTNWLQHWELAQSIRTELKAKLGGAAFDEAWERGAQLNLEETVYNLIDRYSDDHPHVENDLLTDREAEILDLLSEGYTNREIGDRLYISIGTVKVHTRNIYEKLAVNSRDDAVERARQLHIL